MEVVVKLNCLATNQSRDREYTLSIPAQLDSDDGCLNTENMLLHIQEVKDLTVDCFSGKQDDTSGKGSKKATPFVNLVDRYLQSAYGFLDIRLHNHYMFPCQDDQVIEEAAEFTKEAIKFQRDKSSRAALHEECIDLVNACFNTLIQDGVPIYDVFETMMKKNQRAIDRFNENGEV